MSVPDGSTPGTGKLDRALVGGVAWTAGAKWLSQLVAWPAVLIMARLLSLGDYGLNETAGFYFVVTNVVAEFGIGLAVLQMRELDMAVAAQLNTIATAMGALAFIVSVAAAPLIAAFFHAPALHDLVIVASLSFILTSTEAIPLGLLQRDMDYRRLSFAESAQAVVTSCVGVSCAFAGFGYWSLVMGNLAGRAANIALVVYWRPVRFAWPRFSEVVAPLRFGMEVAVQRIVGSINGLSDSMVIGRTMGQAPVGAYRLAANLASTPSEKIGGLIMRVTGPLFSRVQHDKELMLRYFLIFTETLAMTIFPLLFGLAILAPETVVLLLGAKWASAGAPLRWLAVFVTIRTMQSLMYQMLATLRLTRFGMWMSLLTFALMPVAFYVASSHGIGAVAMAWLAMSPITVLPVALKVFREIGCGIPQYVGALLPAIAGSGAMWLAIVVLQPHLTLHGWARLIAEVVAGGLAYCLCVWGLYRHRVMRFVHFFARLRQSQSAAVAAL